jgi:tRNA threonylcarbamoyl adenosine modification protein YeaZ
VIESKPSGLVLVLDLSASLYLAVLDSDRVLRASRIREQGTRGETAHDLLDECLSEAGASPRDLHSLCIGTGPGSFTGIRVGVAMVQGLGFAKQLPIYPYSSLAAMHVSVANSRQSEIPGLSVTAAIAANAGQYFVRFGVPAQEKLIAGESLLQLAPSTSILVTSGKTSFGDPVPFQHLVRMEDFVDFPKIAAMALTNSPILDGSVRPNYLQASAAEDKRRAQEQGGPT